MVIVTNNTKQFIEEEHGSVYIYSADNPGYWVGYYLKRCGIDAFAGYFDEQMLQFGTVLNGKPVLPRFKLTDLKDSEIRLILSSRDYKRILQFINKTFGEREQRIVCLIPEYPHPVNKSVIIYNINKLMAYFRRKLIHVETPTIISNDCTAGYLYHHLEMFMLSPTINVWIAPGDFIKLAVEPGKYLSDKMVFQESFVGYERCGLPQFSEERPFIMLNDIKIIFAHEDSYEAGIKKWNAGIEMMKTKRMLFVLSDKGFHVSHSQLKAFSKVKYPKLFSCQRTLYRGWGGVEIPTIFWDSNYFMDKDEPIENHIDIVDLINEISWDETTTSII